MTTSSPMRKGAGEEYTDYSCSTSIERLARDVETLLRSWHVDGGNDRHISIANAAGGVMGQKHNKSSQDSTPNATKKQLRSTSQASPGGNNSTAGTSWTKADALLLRSDTLSWTVSLTNAGRPLSFTVELQLTLWDGPIADVVEDREHDKHVSHLPHALRRQTQMTNMPECFFENFSSLFGIGQHITLTSTRQTSLQNLLQGDMQFLAHSIMQRHGDGKTTRWILHQVLSTWLQTALNCAVSSCHCCIPVFGLWGSYYPQTSQSNLRYQSQSQGSLQVLPSWLRDILHADIPAPYRVSHKQFWERQALQNDKFVPSVLSGMVVPTASTSANFWCSFIPGSPTSPSRLTSWSSILLQHCPEDTVVLLCARHVFAWWKQPLQKASAFELLFHPDNYHYEDENNPHVAWRRQPKAMNSKGGRPAPRITRTTEDGSPRHVIDLTGEPDEDEDSMQAYLVRLEKYKDECQTLALSLLEQAAGASASEPMWGPVDDPVACIHATATWNGSPVPSSPSNGAHSENNNSTPSQDADTESEELSRQPLLSFPLRIRSRHSMSQEDWVEMEESVERTVLDPLRPSQFNIQVWWDRETPVASLAATQRCVLAALIRTATLPDETLLKHIADDAVLEQWDNASGNVVASCLAQQANVGPTTKALVDAMDWDTAAEDKMEPRGADVLVRHILQQDNGSNFPKPPISPIGDTINTTTQNKLAGVAAAAAVSIPYTSQPKSFGEYPRDGPTQSVSSTSSMPDVNAFAPLFKSAPLGRLVSILCVHMARLRSPCSMAMLWIAFCSEIRMRWEHRQQIPHMNYVPGLDPSPLDMKERNQCLTTLGVKAEQDAVWQSHLSSSSTAGVAAKQSDTEFIGDHHCLIGQKLKVINLCIEMATLEEQQSPEQSDKRPRLEETELVDGSNTSGISRNRENVLVGSSYTSIPDACSNGENEEFADAMSDTGVFAIEDGAAFAAAAAAAARCAHLSQEERKGTRYPIMGSNLVATGEQLFAPYLQRPYPLTDDVVAERRMMLARHLEPPPSSQQGIDKRLEVSYRLQKPKLLSDMSAFKAANPSAIFQDFINWYGNPGNPLDEYSDTRNSHGAGTSIADLLLGRASTESIAIKLDKASEAIQMLNETREFWARTWEEASPKAASEQGPLFDALSTVEMAIDFLENMHPAILVNQVLAVNLSVAYFTLLGAAKEAGVLKIGGHVQRYFQRLREKTESALDLLSGDATMSSSASFNGTRHQEGSSSFVSQRVISACDIACDALSEAEVTTARATSLLHKFPEQYELVESILKREPGNEIVLSDTDAQYKILGTIQKQQNQQQPPTNQLPSADKSAALAIRPVLREYVLRNLDDTHPCQLSVRFGDELAMGRKPENRDSKKKGTGLNGGGGIIIALTKTVRG